MNKKYLFLFLLLVFIFIYFQISTDKLLLNIISMLVYMQDTMGEYYIGKLNFDLADDNEQIRIGETEKYVLVASDGSKWLFKVETPQDEAKTQIAYKLGSIFGVNVPEMYKFFIHINGIKKTGFLQRMLPSGSQDMCINELIEQKSGLVSSIFINNIFSFLLYGPDNLDSLDLMIIPSGAIYQVDLNNLFDLNEEDLTFDLAYRFPIVFQRINDINIDFKQAYVFLKHIYTIDSKWLIKFINKTLNKNKSDSYINIIVIRLIKRKEALLKDFCEHYSLHRNFYIEDLERVNISLYRMSMVKEIYKDISRKLINLIFLRRQRNKNNLAVIASGNALRYVSDFLEELPGQKELDLYETAENELKSMRYNCTDFWEKLAITLYMRQIRTLKEYTDTYGRPEIENGEETLVSILYNIYSFKNYPSLDPWFNLVKYQTRGCILPVKLKGEDEYILGLIKLIDEQYYEARQYLISAQKEGYAINEIQGLLSPG